MDTESLYIFYKEMLDEPDFKGGWILRDEPHGRVFVEGEEGEYKERMFEVHYEVEDVSLVSYGLLESHRAARVLAKLFPEPKQWNFLGSCHCEENQDVKLYNLAFFKILYPLFEVHKVYAYHDRPLLYVSKYRSHQFLTLWGGDIDSDKELWLFAPVDSPRTEQTKDIRSIFTDPIGGAIYAMTFEGKYISTATFERVLAADIETRFGDSLPDAGEMCAHGT